MLNVGAASELAVARRLLPAGSGRFSVFPFPPVQGFANYQTVKPLLALQAVTHWSMFSGTLLAIGLVSDP
jgi:hypothetical protein